MFIILFFIFASLRLPAPVPIRSNFAGEECARPHQLPCTRAKIQQVWVSCPRVDQAQWEGGWLWQVLQTGPWDRWLLPVLLRLWVGVGLFWITFKIPFLEMFIYFMKLKQSKHSCVVFLLSGMRRKLVVAILWWTPCYESALKGRFSLWTASPHRLTWLSASGHWTNG